jgi:hypothetical protein
VARSLADLQGKLPGIISDGHELVRQPGGGDCMTSSAAEIPCRVIPAE